MELIRFYFGSSGALLSRLFVPPLSKDKLFTSMTIHPKTGVMNLCLAEGIPAASKEDVARIAGCKEAWQAAQAIIPSMQRAAMLRVDPHPQSSFPFEGTTTLCATGKWLSLGDQAEQTFLVFHLNSCSHEFPYSKLFFTQDGASGDMARLPAPPQASAQAPNKVTRSKAADGYGLVDQNPSTALQAIERAVPRRRRFTDLDEKPTRRGRKFTRRRPVVTTSASVPDTSNLADGAPVGSRTRVRCVELVEVTDTRDWVPPAFLGPVIAAIESIPDIDCTLLTGSDDDGWTVPLLLLFDDDGVIANELMIYRGGHALPRRVAAFRLGLRGAFLVLVVVEDSQFVPLLYPLGKGHSDDPWPFVELAAADYLERANANPKLEDSAVQPGEPVTSSWIASWLLGELLASQRIKAVDKPQRGVALIISWVKARLFSLLGIG
jgi:hypothetical protein